MRRILTLSAVATVVCLILAVPAFGTNWLGHTAGYDSHVTFNKISLTSDMSTAVNWNNSNNVLTTKLTTSVYSNSSYQREVDIYDANYGATGWAGRWYCQRSALQGECLVGVVQLNTHYGYDTAMRRQLVCHEIGHSLGLNHPTSGTSCVRTGSDATTWSYTYLSTHDKGHINSIYP